MDRIDEELLADCLFLCSLPLGSPERLRFGTQLVEKWSAKVLWSTIEHAPEYFLWWLAAPAARLTVLGEKTLKTLSAESKSADAILPLDSNKVKEPD